MPRSSTCPRCDDPSRISESLGTDGEGGVTVRNDDVIRHARDQRRGHHSCRARRAQRAHQGRAASGVVPPEPVTTLYRGGCLLILDQPTSALVWQEVDQLFANLRQLRSTGVSICSTLRPRHQTNSGRT